MHSITVHVPGGHRLDNESDQKTEEMESLGPFGAIISHSHEQMGGKPLDEADCFTYLGSKISKTGGTEEDTKARIQKARVAFLMLNKIWKSKLIKTKTKMRIFNSSVKSVLLYSSETWRIITKHTVNRIQTFANRCLRRIMNVKWSDKESNNTL